MAMMDWIEQELRAARRELEQAEVGLGDNTDAARTRYARALHEADLAEHRAAHLTRRRNRLGESWLLAAV